MIRRAYHELLETRQLSTSKGHDIIPQACAIPGWFPAIELGLAWGQGPSIFSTLEDLPNTNRKNLAAFAEQERPEVLEAAKRNKRRDQQIARQYAKIFQSALRRFGVQAPAVA